MVSGHLSIMDNDEQPKEVLSPSQRIIVFASIACFVSLTFFCWVARPAVELLKVRWAELSLYALIPISVTFFVLYRSCWHREIAGVVRACSLLLIACVILGAELFATGFLFYLAVFCFNGISGGNH